MCVQVWGVWCAKSVNELCLLWQRRVPGGTGIVMMHWMDPHFPDSNFHSPFLSDQGRIGIVHP